MVGVLAVLSSIGRTDGQTATPEEDWPQWRGPNRDGVWKAQGLLDKFETPQIKARWRVPVGNGYSGPTVAGGRVYLTDRVTEPVPLERIHCLDWKTGKPLWRYDYACNYAGVNYPDGPRAAVTVREGAAYALGAKGHLHCLDAVTGKVKWSHDLYTEYDIDLPVWGIAAAPLLEGGLVITQIGGARDACVVAFDAKTGKERWRALADKASYSAPIIVEQAGKRVLVCWTGERVVGLDPQTGKLYWDSPFPSKQVVIAVASPVVQGDRLFLTSFYQGSLMLQLSRDKPAVKPLWQRCGQNERNTDALHSIISTPLLLGDHIYGVDSYGELRCLDAKTGDRVWEDRTAVPRARWATIHFVRAREHIWMFNERGQVILADLTPRGYKEITRAQLIKPTTGQLADRGGVCWSHPAFAYGHIFARNDEELVCASLKKER